MPCHWSVCAAVGGRRTGIRDRRLRWREAAFEEIVADDFLKGCAAGIAKRYLDYHPDPRDCRLVAEAECAKVDLLVTLNGDLINGLAQRAENVRILTPSKVLRRIMTASDHRS